MAVLGGVGEVSGRQVRCGRLRTNHEHNNALTPRYDIGSLGMTFGGQSHGFLDSTGNPLLKKPDEIRPGVNALIFDEQGRVLLERRSDNGWWGLPGGAMDRGESASEAVVREVLEETGLTVTIKRLVGIYSDPALQVITEYPDGNVVQWVTMAFECERSHGELRLSDESTDMNYFAADDLPPKTLPPHRTMVDDALANSDGPFIR